MDSEVYGPYKFDQVCGLGILPDTLICPDAPGSNWQMASLYPEFASLFQENNERRPSEMPSDSSSGDFEELLKYKQKRKAALIGVLSLGLAGLSIVGIGNTWKNNIFRGTSMMKNEGVGFILKVLSFCFLSVLIAIPVFIISIIQLFYYSIMIAKYR